MFHQKTLKTNPLDAISQVNLTLLKIIFPCNLTLRHEHQKFLLEKYHKPF